MTDKNTIAADILGELIPQLGYAAPVLLQRFERGEPLVGAKSSTDLGFDPGPVDSVILEFFKALVPYVQAALGWGALGVLQAWRLSKKGSRSQAELTATLGALIGENAKLREAVEKIAELLSRMDGAPVSTDYVVDSIAAAAARRSDTADDARSRV